MAKRNYGISKSNPPTKTKKQRVRSNARYFIKGVNVASGKELQLTECKSLPVALAAFNMAKTMSDGVLRDLVILKTIEVTPGRKPADSDA